MKKPELVCPGLIYFLNGYNGYCSLFYLTTQRCGLKGLKVTLRVRIDNGVVSFIFTPRD